MFHNTVGGRRLAISLCAGALATALAGCGSKADTTAQQPAPPPPSTAETGAVPTPTPVTPDVATPTRPQPQLPGAIGVMVENSPQARPQAGLDQADLVYEMESEGGVSRFLALFYQEKAERIGPVRSARMGFYDVATAYAIPYAHAGGNNDVLIELKERNKRLLNLDEIYTCGYCFWRGTEREAPHNLYTSTDKILARAQEVSFGLKPIHRFDEGAPTDGGKPVTELAFSWGPGTQDVSWSWNGKRYERSQSGGPHKMESGAQIQADNVVVLFTKYVWDSAAQWGEGQYNISIVGSGSGYLYREGKAWPIRWDKGAREEHYKLTTTDGKPVRLAVGKTWVEVLKTKEHVVKGLPE